MGECQVGKQQYEEALIYLQKAHKIYQTRINWEKNPDFATTLCNMGISLIELQKYADVFKRFKESLKIYKKFSSNEHIASQIESIRCKIDQC